MTAGRANRGASHPASPAVWAVLPGSTRMAGDSSAAKITESSWRMVMGVSDNVFHLI